MQFAKKIFALSLVALGVSAHVVFAGVPPLELANGTTTVAPMLKKVIPAVVNIVNQGQLTLTEDPFLRRELYQLKIYSLLENKPFVSFGSGVIIDAKKGLIVTNAHVVDLDKKITVTLKDGRHFEAKKLGADNKTDIALIQIRANNLTAVSWGDSDSLNVGDFVAAIGSPFELNHTVTAGVVSALHRSDLGIEGLENFIQTDAAINMGSSGGALVNLKGELVGINTALLAGGHGGGNIGIGFAIPSTMVKNITSQILDYGKVSRGFIGVLVQNLTPDLADAFHVTGLQGALVSQVLTGSPADNAGIKIGDIMTQINGETITSNDDVHNFVGLLRVGDEAKINLLHDGKKLLVSVKVADPKKLEEQEESRTKPAFYGVRLENVVEQSPDHGYHQAVRVVDVDEYSTAFIAGLRPDDVIVTVNRQPVHDIQQLDEIAMRANDNGVLLNILRDKSSLFIVIK